MCWLAKDMIYSSKKACLSSLFLQSLLLHNSILLWCKAGLVPRWEIIYIGFKFGDPTDWNHFHNGIVKTGSKHVLRMHECKQPGLSRDYTDRYHKLQGKNYWLQKMPFTHSLAASTQQHNLSPPPTKTVQGLLQELMQQCKFSQDFFFNMNKCLLTNEIWYHTSSHEVEDGWMYHAACSYHAQPQLPHAATVIIIILHAAYPSYCVHALS